MNIELKGINITITPSLEQYVWEKFRSIEKLLVVSQKKESNVRTHIEVMRTTKHHHKGDVIDVRASCIADGVVYRASYTASDARVAIDEVKNELTRQIISRGERQTSKYLRGARLLKRLTHFSPLTWFSWRKGSRDREEGM